MLKIAGITEIVSIQYNDISEALLDTTPDLIALYFGVSQNIVVQIAQLEKRSILRPSKFGAFLDFRLNEIEEKTVANAIRNRDRSFKRTAEIFNISEVKVYDIAKRHQIPLPVKGVIKSTKKLSKQTLRFKNGRIYFRKASKEISSSSSPHSRRLERIKKSNLLFCCHLRNRWF